jgi:uncharacterized membrane protein YedE/YeeE
MTAPLIGEDALDASLFAAVALGIGFGFALERAGLGNARKLTAQFYGRDFTVLKVMFSALLVAMLGVFWLSRLGLLDLRAVYVPPTYLWPQAVGGLVFGAGLVVAGLCPGTACVATATGRIDGLFVLLGMLAGMVAVGCALPLFAEFFESGAHGAWTLPDLTGFSYGAVVAGVVAMALLAFAGAEWIERRVR